MNVWLTFYCACSVCCGRHSPDRGGHGLTASGKVPVPWVTVAAPSRYRFGTVIRVDCPELGWSGRRFVVHDRTANPNQPNIDIYVGNHAQAMYLGRRKAKITKPK